MAKAKLQDRRSPALGTRLRCAVQDLWVHLHPADLTTAISLEFPLHAEEVGLEGPLFSAAECLMADRNADGSWRVVRRSYDLEAGNGLYRYDTLLARTTYAQAVQVLQRFESNHPHRIAYRQRAARRPDAEGFGPPHVSRVAHVRADRAQARREAAARRTVTA